jgi:hypothetical protein
MVISSGFEEDGDIRAALAWFAAVSGNPQTFFERLARGQQAYRAVTGSPENRGLDPSLDMISPDVVGAFLAQAKSLLDDRRSYDQALASQIVPWIKQIGRNVDSLRCIPGAVERAARMLRSESVVPDSAIFELVMAANYVTNAFDVAFIDEAKGQSRTPDLCLSAAGLSQPIFVECKRLKRGQYETQELSEHKKLFLNMVELIHHRRLSIHVDVTYTQELGYVPDRYLADHLMNAVTSPIFTPRGYPWRDEFGSGVVKRANLVAVRQDIHRNGSLYCGTKLARLLCGDVVRESGYHLAVGAYPDERDPRFIDSLDYGSVVTWQCIAPAAIEKKARYVKAKVVEADRQLKTHGSGIVHLAMDMELQCESSDMRRTRNIAAIRAFRPLSDIRAIYVHYLVPRVSEFHLWLVDETVDRFGQGADPVPSLMIFPAAANIDNELPAWKQQV